VSLLAYSPLGFGLLTGKYDASGIEGPGAPAGRASPASKHAQAALGPPRGAGGRAPLQRAGARARPDAHQMALAFCYTSWRVASTIIGVTVAGAARRRPGRLGHHLSPELLAEIDRIRWELRDPA
jgi:aryl-alcohol dehydrogenase-like predicted oxidoreductase